MRAAGEGFWTHMVEARLGPDCRPRGPGRPRDRRPDTSQGDLGNADLHGDDRHERRTELLADFLDNDGKRVRLDVTCLASSAACAMSDDPDLVLFPAGPCPDIYCSRAYWLTFKKGESAAN